jgi:hypothetical protein
MFWDSKEKKLIKLEIKIQGLIAEYKECKYQIERIGKTSTEKIDSQIVLKKKIAELKEKRSWLLNGWRC